MIDDRTVPIEVGTSKRYLAQLDSVEDKKYGLLINSNLNEVRVDGTNISVPLKWFLLI